MPVRAAAKLLGSVALKKMPSHLAHAPAPSIRARTAERGDLDALLDLEHRVFATDRLSRRSLRRFLQSKSAQVIVADDGGRLAGAAVVLFRPSSSVARLYSIAVAPHLTGRGVGAMLLAAAEEAALARDCTSIRLEVHETNHAAISRYRKSGYRRVRAALPILRRRRRRAAVREAVGAAAARTGERRRRTSIRPPSSPAGRPA